MTDPLATLLLGTTPIELRRAEAADVPLIVALLVDDVLGKDRDGDEDLDPYFTAFAAIDADPSHLLVVAYDGDAVVATLQLSYLPGLARRAALRGQLEAVHVAASYRGRGLGAALLGWAVDRAREDGCGLVQLTSDKRRPEAHRFYERQGFTASHEGFKLIL